MEELLASPGIGVPEAAPVAISERRDARAAAIEIAAASYAAATDDAEVSVREDAAAGKPVLVWGNSSGSVEWRFAIEQAGFYEIWLDYLPTAEGYNTIIRGVAIDGDYPYAESERLELSRYWMDSRYPYNKDTLGNEVRAAQVEEAGWRTQALANYEASPSPLRFYLTAGEHRLRLDGVQQPVTLGAIAIVPAAELPAYADYVREAAPAEAAAQPTAIVVEGEAFRYKSQVGIQKQALQEAEVTPDGAGRIAYNAMGGDRWQNAGQWLEWEVEVPEDGWYELDMKYKQSYIGGANVYRTLYIDGYIPFREAASYKFPYSRGFAVHTLQDGNGQPYRFYLEAGIRQLRLVADASPVRRAVLALHEMLAELRKLDNDIRVLTGDYGKYGGGNADTNRTWELERYMPDIHSRMQHAMDGLRLITDYLEGLNQSETDLTTSIKLSLVTLEDMLANVEKLPNRLSELAAIQSSIGTWISTADTQPLLIDSLALRTPDTATPLRTAGALQRWGHAALSLARSFVQPYTAEPLEGEKAITVWVQRGRDYVDLLQELITQDFTPRTGIHVNISLMPNPNVLILGNAAGNQPDAALGIAMESPVDFAMRGAAADLSKLKGYSEIQTRFHPGMMRTYQYGGGTYGLPELQNFLVFFYRTDLFRQYGLEPPDTWEDVYKLLPTLQENGKTLYYPAKEFAPFFYQAGVDFYAADGMSTRLGEEAAVAPFEQWLQLFRRYYLPLEVPAFFNHFRFGDIPAGIADFSTYIQLVAAAPDIAGHWAIAPLPGTRQRNGEVARWAQQPSTAAMIMANSSKQDEAWQFLDWWTSTETQLRYADQIESFLGVEYRWNSANLEAFGQSWWPQEHLTAIKEQLRWTKNIPLVPGYYYLGREMDFAWNRVLLDGMPEKEALEKAALSMRREMQRKQEEFGLGADDDLRLPQIDQPFEWGSE
ncbi:hypothetical protein PA598K_00006 [Paenibacillus sp. 598K]|nr:hypothetical protein PA598K_00006 [Paenibacillus sp. 598K]